MNLNIAGFLKSNIENGHFTDRSKEKIINSHDRQIVSNLNLTVLVVEIRFSYTTVRGNPKVGSKIFMENSFSAMEESIAKKILENYIADLNKNNPKRKLSNVKFLGAESLGCMSL